MLHDISCSSSPLLDTDHAERDEVLQGIIELQVFDSR